MSTNNNNSSYPLWLKQDAHNHNLLESSSEQPASTNSDVLPPGHSGNQVTLSSLLAQNIDIPIQVGQHLGLGNYAGMHDDTMTSACLPTNNGQGMMGRIVNKDVLDLYDLLKKLAQPQNQPQDPMYASQQGINVGAPLGQSMPFDFQQNQHFAQDFGSNASDNQHRGPYSALPNSIMHQNQDASSFSPHNMTNFGTNTLGNQFINPENLSGYDTGISTFQMMGTDNFTGHNLQQQPMGNGQPEPPKPIPKHPLRALSAYNFFFRDERDRIVNETEGQYETTPDKKRELLERHWFRDRTTKRRHRKTHGKIAFTELSKVISQRWKGLSADVKNFYHEVAAEDTLRYNREVDAQRNLSA